MPKYTVTGLEKWVAAATNQARFKRFLDARMRVATELNGKFIERAMRKTIQASDGLEANAPLTIHIKKSKKPLVATGELFKAITSRVINNYTVFVGVQRSDGQFNIAKLVHEGTEIAVTPEMRGMFFYLWKASEGELDPSELSGRAAEIWAASPGGYKPLDPATTHVVIPARPWATVTFASLDLRERVAKNWHTAIKRAFADQARGSAT